MKKIDIEVIVPDDRIGLHIMLSNEKAFTEVFHDDVFDGIINEDGIQVLSELAKSVLLQVSDKGTLPFAPYIYYSDEGMAMFTFVGMDYDHFGQLAVMYEFKGVAS